jgi:aminodeoxyfutalosine synthase
MGTANIEIIIASEKDNLLQKIGNKVIHNERISFEEGVYLFEKASLPYVGALANWKRESLHGDTTYFNKNFHIEPTNVCVFSCKFCSYSKLYAHKEEGWELTIDQMMDIVKSYDGKPVTEVHIVGGVHPKLTLDFFISLLKAIKAHRPELHIKGFTPVELDYM